MAFFEGLIVTEDGATVSVAHIGAESFYVIDDQGFRRHIDAAEVDRPVMAQFLAQLQEHKDEAGQAMLKMIGQDDLFTKAMVDSTLDNITLDQMIGQTLPPDAQQWLSMLGFRVVINLHGEVVRVDMPTAAEEGWDGE
jgi:hypothetical protein